MKRIISALLTVAMLVTLITVPMMVTADAWSAPSTIDNTSDVFNTDFHFYATKGTPTIDGVIDAAWANAYTLRLDASRRVDAKGNVPSSLMNNVYVMWDENNLYILEEYEYDKPVYDAALNKNYNTGGKDCSLYYVVLPNDMTKDSSKLGAVNMPHVAPGDVSQITGETKAVPSHVFGRERAYTKTSIDPANAAGSVGSIWSYSDEALAARYAEGITSYTAYTDHGWFLETAISWDFLDYHNAEDFAPAIGTEIGFIVNSNNGQGNGSYYVPQGDHIGFSVLELVETNPTNVIVPDLTWINDPECITEDGYYMISDAADLYGMALLSLGHGSYTDFSSLGLTVGAGKAFSGKKFRIMNDIDLNPGWDVTSGVAPAYCWPGINFFASAEIDGNGKTISGLYNVRGIDYSDYKDGHGFISRMGNDVNIHDLSFVNGKLVGDSNDNVGTVVGLIHNCDTSTVGNSKLVNIHSSLIVEGSSGKIGGIVGGNWSKNAANNVLIEDCVFTGTANCAIAGQRDNGKTKVTQKNCFSTLTTNYSSADTSDAAYVQSTDVVDGKINVRLLGLIDETELDLDSVGMKVTVTYGEETYTKELDGKTNVFATVNAAGTEIAVESLEGDYDYAYGVVLKGVPAGAEDEVTIDVVLTRVIDGVEVQSVCTYSATYKAGVLQ